MKHQTAIVRITSVIGHRLPNCQRISDMKTFTKMNAVEPQPYEQHKCSKPKHRFDDHKFPFRADSAANGMTTASRLLIV